MLVVVVEWCCVAGLGWGTLVGAVLGGGLWLLGWHMFQRPFHSSLLIIIMAVLFVGMMVTYFLRCECTAHTGYSSSLSFHMESKVDYTKFLVTHTFVCIFYKFLHMYIFVYCCFWFVFCTSMCIGLLLMYIFHVKL